MRKLTRAMTKFQETADAPEKNIDDYTDEEILKLAAESNMDIYDRFLVQQMRAKKMVKFSQDSYSLAYLCFYKENIKKY